MTLILASQSASRRAMLTAAGVDHSAVPADLDERSIEAGLAGSPPQDIALALAVAKADAVARLHPGALVLGSDSLVEIGGRRFDKPRSRAEAAEHLRFFSGKEMQLHSAAALARDGAAVWQHCDTARLAVRELSEAFIAGYLDHEWPAVAGCVGVFRIEARGVQLFEAVSGDHYTVLGMPLLPVLRALRDNKAIAA
ncbi:septum formation protein [Novosphingobium kunmingense]|uniref:Nucleoside triphosphate pyrophosphatase n=1 Tax=Novosphingobium kunmingense TaxID=1211806 RepID=A0A2N0H503_9SPHN|nr:Maf family protein [Novosphingobium kunmingense]PKB14008.1 septum formation protein [Novosphingobium kunmingense]